MTLDESLAHWQRERARLEALDAWIDAGKTKPPQPLTPVVGVYLSLDKPGAKDALKAAREEAGKDAFIRMFAAFEHGFRPVFCDWLAKKCGLPVPSPDIAKALPDAIRGVLDIAAALEPRLDASRRGYAGNVMSYRNDLVHRGFAAPLPYDLVVLHCKLSEIIAIFAVT